MSLHTAAAAVPPDVSGGGAAVVWSCPACRRDIVSGRSCPYCGAGSAGSSHPRLPDPPGGELPFRPAESPEDAFLDDVSDLELLPSWYQDMASQVHSDNLPSWRAVHEDQLLAGWSEEIMAETAARYAVYYSEGRVTSASALFRKIAQGVASGRVRSGIRSPPRNYSKGPRRR